MPQICRLACAPRPWCVRLWRPGPAHAGSLALGRQAPQIQQPQPTAVAGPQGGGSEVDTELRGGARMVLFRWLGAFHDPNAAFDACASRVALRNSISTRACPPTCVCFTPTYRSPMVCRLLPIASSASSSCDLAAAGLLPWCSGLRRSASCGVSQVDGRRINSLRPAEEEAVGWVGNGPGRMRR